MLIQHLALTVADPEQSVDFYLSVIGLEGEARETEWGYRLDLRDGFMLALMRGEPVPSELVHFGCALADREQAVAVRDRLRAAGTDEIEWEDEGDYTGVKVRDPDGYIVELSYDTA